MKYMCMIALVALAVTSCNKTKEEQPRRSTFKATTEDVEFEDLDESRAYIDTNKICFETGDVVMLFNLSKEHPSQSHCATYEAIEAGNKVTFQNCYLGQVAEDQLDGGYFAFYSGNFISGDSIEHHVITELSEGENKSKFFLSPTQTYRQDMVAKNALHLVASVKDDTQLADVNLTFESTFGILSLKPYESNPRSVTQIKIIDNALDLSGWVELILDEFDYDEMVRAFNIGDSSWEAWKTKVGYQHTGPNMGNSVTLNIDPPVQLGTSKPNTPTFNIVLPPMALYNGCHIVLTFSDGSVKDCTISNGSLLIKPNVIKNVGMNLDNL